MAKAKFDTSFDFGANLARGKPSPGARKGRRGRRKLTPAQQYTAALYLKRRRR